MARANPLRDSTTVLDITEKGLERVDRIRGRSTSMPLDFRLLIRLSYEPLSIEEIVSEFGSGARESMRALLRSGDLEVSRGYY